MIDPPRPDEPDRVVIRDKRRIDPVTGQARPAADAPAPEPEPDERDIPKAEALLLEERTRDLQRVQAEYANYRKRAERERLAATDVATARVLAELLPVLDDIERARSHGDLSGGLKSIAEQLELILTKLGLEAFGEVGDRFDPTIHEAVMHNESEHVTEPTSTTVMRKGYRHGERMLRPAMVGVSDPAQAPPVEGGDEADGGYGADSSGSAADSDADD